MNFKPMLAAKTTHAELDALRYPMLMSPKLDGFRAIVINGKLRSRKFEPVPSRVANQLYGHDALNGLDGEIVYGDPTAEDVFNKTARFMSREKALTDPRHLMFYVFDDFSNPTLPYHRRLEQARQKIAAFVTTNSHMVLLPHVSVPSAKILTQFEEKVVTKGFEGVMLRDPDAPYKYGRSTLSQGWLIKLKRFEDSEALILEVRAEKHNENAATVNKLGYTKRSSHKDGKSLKETCGSLRVVDCNKESPMHGVEFRVGSGIDDEMGNWLWRNRRVVEGQLRIHYRYQPVGVLDKPRFVTFKGLVKKWDR